MATDDGESREQGIEFGPFAEALEGETYPLSHDDLLDRYGDRELGLSDGRTTVDEVLEPENETEYEDAESVRQAVFTMVGDRAIGRAGYSDRGRDPQDETPSDGMDSV